MRKSHCRHLRRNLQKGQTTAIILVFLSAFLLGVIGLATDYTQVWAHRQMAQAAADASCQAGAADLYLNFQNATGATGAYGLDFSWIGGAGFNCSSKPGSAPCQYAAKNGYSGSQVNVTFPTSIPGVPALSGFGTVANPYIKVTITDSVNLSFARFLSSSNSVNANASASCGMSPVSVPIPLVVLHKTSAGALSLSGNPSIQIYGGPSRSIQVDSSSTTAFSPGGASSAVDLTHAGPSGTGADFGVFGKETQPGTVSLGTGTWISPATPYGDPWAVIAAPTQPALGGTVTSVGFGVNGCPDPTGCTEFSAGDYVGCSSTNGNLASGSKGCLAIPVSFTITFGNRNAANNNTAFAAGARVRPTTGNAGNYVYRTTAGGTSGGVLPVWPQVTGQTVNDGTIIWTNVGSPINKPNTAIFDPGVYYVGTEGLQLNSNSTVRTSTATGDGSGGATFYFSNAGTVSVSANSGKASTCTAASPGSGTPNNCVVAYKVAGTAGVGGVLSRALQCPLGPANSPQVPATVDGNILLGPCTGTYAANSNDGQQYRGFLFFQNRANAVNPSWGGGGQFLLAGFMYFHSTSYGSTLSLSGNSGAGAFTLGNIVADKISLGGSSGIKMILNSANSYQILRPQLLQ